MAGVVLYTTVNIVLFRQNVSKLYSEGYSTNRTPHLNLAKLEIDRLFPLSSKVGKQNALVLGRKRNSATICGQRYSEKNDILKMVSKF